MSIAKKTYRCIPARTALGGPCLCLLLLAGAYCSAADIQCPNQVVAGAGIVCHTSGSGSATLYISGPGTTQKREIDLGQDVTIKPEDLRTQGRYLISTGRGSVAQFFVSSAPPASIVFMARPSRVPAGPPGAVTGSAFVYDAFRNLVLTSVPVTFNLSMEGGVAAERKIPSRDGIAYVNYPSPSRSGTAEFLASAEAASVRRIVTVVAADPCGISFSAHPEEKSIVAETAPIRDCGGNVVPNGTIVTFTETDRTTGERSQVDAPIKRGVARAQLPLATNAALSAASGVVIGNQVNIQERR